MIIHCPPKPYLFFVFVLLFSIVFSPSIVHAAAPDGVGPWADSVVSSSQGFMKNGLPVPLIRSNPAATLGVAENDTVDSHFYSLGFAGSITLGFDNPVSGGVIVVEATNPDYPLEKAMVEVSENGTTWISAGSVSQDGQVPVPENVKCAKYVRITDISNKIDFSDGTADGYDVDGVKTTGGKTCEGGNTTVTIDHSSDCTIKQQTKTIVTNVITTSSNTGKNKVKKITGSTSHITTGKSKSTTVVTVTGGSNTSDSSCCGCCSEGDTTVVVSGNG